MKALNVFFVSIVLVLLMVFSSLQAATNYNETASKAEHYGALVYSGTVTFTDSSNGDIYYTQKMKVSASNSADGYGRFICSEAGTEDVNVFIEYSFDGITWITGTTDADLDAVGTTAVVDTLGIVQGVNQILYHMSPYMRFKFVVGQNMNSTTLTWNYWMSKNSGVELKSVGGVSNTPTS